jgi:threonine dehydrogenase-like Zn-dependent dehydrogenase
MYVTCRGADVALEVVGSNGALQLAFEALRPMGTLSSVGVHTAPAFPFTPQDGNCIL